MEAGRGNCYEVLKCSRDYLFLKIPLFIKLIKNLVLHHVGNFPAEIQMGKGSSVENLGASGVDIKYL